MPEGRGSFWTLLIPGAGWVAAFVVAPLAMMAVTSLLTNTPDGPAAPLTLRHYAEAIGNADVRGILVDTALWSAAIGAAAVLLAYPLALFAAGRGPAARAAMLFLILVPLWTNYFVRVYAWRTILGNHGALNTALVGLGLLDEPSDRFLYTRFSVVVTLLYVTLPFAFVPVFAALERIPPALRDAAADLGAGPGRRFLHVTLPLSLPGVVTGFGLAFLYALGDYVTPRVVGGTEGLMIGRVIQDQFGLAANPPLGAALGFTLFVGVLVALGALQRVGNVQAVFEE